MSLIQKRGLSTLIPPKVCSSFQQLPTTLPTADVAQIASPAVSTDSVSSHPTRRTRPTSEREGSYTSSTVPQAREAKESFTGCRIIFQGHSKYVEAPLSVQLTSTSLLRRASVPPRMRAACSASSTSTRSCPAVPRLPDKQRASWVGIRRSTSATSLPPCVGSPFAAATAAAEERMLFRARRGSRTKPLTLPMWFRSDRPRHRRSDAPRLRPELLLPSA